MTSCIPREVELVHATRLLSRRRGKPVEIAEAIFEPRSEVPSVGEESHVARCVRRGRPPRHINPAVESWVVVELRSEAAGEVGRWR